MSPENLHSTCESTERKASEHIAFDNELGTYRAEFDHHSRPPSIAVLEAISTAFSVDLLDLPPLHSVVDLDAIDQLFTPSSTGQSHSEATVTFTFRDHSIRVHSQGIIDVDPLTEETEKLR